MLAPNVPWLAKQLAIPAPEVDAGADKALLSVGGVFYNEPLEESTGNFSKAAYPWTAEAAQRSRFVRSEKKYFLPGSVVESRYAMHCAGRKPKLLVEGNAASVGKVVELLPKSNYAILSTHGKYTASPSLASGDPAMLDSKMILS